MKEAPQQVRLGAVVALFIKGGSSFCFLDFPGSEASMMEIHLLFMALCWSQEILSSLVSVCHEVP